MQKVKYSVILAAAAVSCVLAAITTAEPTDAQKKASEKDGKVYVTMTTTLGDMVIELNRERAPITVANFLSYADSGFYEGTMFHRIIKSFMIQGGGMTEGYTKKGTKEQIQNEADNGLKNTYGTLAMARTGAPHSATSQFFINVKDNQGTLNHKGKNQQGWGYCVFGRVIDGLDTVEKIRNTPVHQDPRADPRQPAAADTSVLITNVVRADTSKLTEAIAKFAGEDTTQATKDAEEAKKKAEALGGGMDAGRALVKSKDVDISKGTTTASGLWHVDVKAGDGDAVPSGARVTVHYTGWLTDGTEFDSSVGRGKPATFNINGVIRGWTEGVGSMKTGGKRFLVIPPEMAYGSQGRPSIPPNAVLVFEVELIEIAG